MSELGRTLFIANPVSRSNKGRNNLALVENIMRGHIEYETFFTREPGDAERIANTENDFDTIVAVGGDGTAHEVINGILRREKSDRPAFGLIPIGSGNDYARTLDMPFRISEAAKCLLYGTHALVDVGLCNGEYFAESLSFGVDAAIAIESIELRKKTGSSGMLLYMKSGIEVLRNQFASYKGRFSFDGGPLESHNCLILSATIGATYGGGFKIAPEADPTDGKLNICIAAATSPRKALGIFLLVSQGWHTGSKIMDMRKVSNFHAEFEDELPVQIDGEQRHGTVFDVSLLPKELVVVVGPNSKVAHGNNL